MSLLHRPIEKRLSMLFGTDVRIGRLDLSLVKRALDVQDLTVAGDDGTRPLLTVRRLHARLAVVPTLRRDIVVKSIVIDGPALSIVVRADGATNLSKLIASNGLRELDTDAAADRDASGASPNGIRRPKRRWTFDAEKVLIVDGELNLQIERSGTQNAYALSARPLTTEISHHESGFDFSCLIDAILTSREAVIPQLRLIGSLGNGQGIHRLGNGPVRLRVDANPLLRISATSPSIASRAVDADVTGTVDLEALSRLLPPLPFLDRLSPRGRAEIDGKLSYDPDRGLHVPDMNVHLSDLSIPPS